MSVDMLPFYPISRPFYAFCFLNTLFRLFGLFLCLYGVIVLSCQLDVLPGLPKNPEIEAAKPRRAEIKVCVRGAQSTEYRVQSTKP